MKRAAILAVLFAFACERGPKEPPPSNPKDAISQLTEQESNDRPEVAQLLSASSSVTASISADPSKPDQDWYLLKTAAPMTANISLSADGQDLAFEAYDAGRNRLAAINSGGAGRPERFPNLGVKDVVYLKVYSPKRAEAEGAYTLKVIFEPVAAGFEVEPNDRAADANALPLGQPISAYLGHSGDEDWYAIDIPPPEAAPPSPSPSAPATVPGSATSPASAEPPSSAANPPELPTPTPAPNKEATAPASEQPPSPSGGAAPSAPSGDVPPAPPGAAPIPPGGANPGAPPASANVPPAPKAPPPPPVLRFSLSAVEGVKWELTVLSEAQAPLLSLKGKEGEVLALRNVGLRANDRRIFVVVKSAWEGTGKESRKGYNADKPYTLTIEPEEAGSSAELEPNDDIGHATSLPLGGFRDAFLSPRGDVDYFALKGDAPFMARVSLSGVEGVDLILSLVAAPPREGQPEQTLLKSNDGGLKEPEHLNNVYCQNSCWLKVEGAAKKVGEKWLRDYENSGQSYRLMAAPVADMEVEEREPNNSSESATPLTLGKPMRGTILPKKDVDFFKLDLSDRPVRTALRADLLGILKVDTALFLYQLEDGKRSLVQTANRAKGDATETISYSAEPGVYLFEVRDSKNREANFQDSYQLTVQEE
jgi:hypothetical protein